MSLPTQTMTSGVVYTPWRLRLGVCGIIVMVTTKTHVEPQIHEMPYRNRPKVNAKLSTS